MSIFDKRGAEIDDIDPSVVDDDVREGIEKQLQRTDLSAEDRAAYETALANINKQAQAQA